MKIESSVFKAVGHNWKLVLEPDLGSTDFLTLMLQHMSEISVTVAICIDVVNKKGASLGRHESKRWRAVSAASASPVPAVPAVPAIPALADLAVHAGMLVNPPVTLRWGRLLSAADVFSPSTGYLIDDTLRLRVSFEVMSSCTWAPLPDRAGQFSVCRKLRETKQFRCADC